MVLGDDPFDDFAGFHAGEALVEALVLKGEALVVDAELVEEGGVEIVDVDGVFDDIITHLVGFAVGEAFFDAAAGGPEAEAARVVIAAVVGFGEIALGVDGAAEFAAEDDEGIVEEAALFKVLDEAVAGLVDVLALGGDIAGERAVLVPAAVKDLDEADAALDEATGHQGAIGKSAAVLGIGAVEFVGLVAFAAEVR